MHRHRLVLVIVLLLLATGGSVSSIQPAQADVPPGWSGDDWVRGGFSIRSPDVQFEVDGAISALAMPMPVDVDIAKVEGGLLLTWASSPANDHYEVHRSTEPYFTPETTTFLDTVPEVGGTNQYTDIDMTGDPVNNYFYRVRSMNFAGVFVDSYGDAGEFDFGLK